MTEKLLTLFCVVDGETAFKAFSVKILSTDYVDHLKKAIKANKAIDFSDVDANELTLWRVSIPITDDDDEIPILLNNVSSDKKKLRPTDDLSEIFVEPPRKKTIHIIVRRPAPSIPYRKPQPLVRTVGQHWMYQPDPELHEILGRTMKDHYRNFSRGYRDKTTIPLYLFLSEAGTGKSRNAQEFHKSAVTCLTEDGDEELRNKIKQAWVFHISLENGTNHLTEETDSMEAVGQRMLHQLLPEKSLEDIIRNFEGVRPMRVFDLVAKGTSQNPESAAGILVVDGVQSFVSNMDDDLNKKVIFYKLMANMADLSISIKNIFLMVCCTTTMNPFSTDLLFMMTHRRRVFLPVASLEPPRIYQDGSCKPVFNEDDHIIKVLVNDCGGHGRALESLQLAIGATNTDFNVETLMNSVYHKFKNLYSEALSIPSSTVQAMARMILMRTFLEAGWPVPGTTKTPEGLAIPGLVRYVQPNGHGTGGYLTAPYIWVWLFSYQPREDADPILRNWRICDYPDLKSKLDARSPSGAQFWQHFEHFVATFRCLKSRVLNDGERTRMSAVHKGARMNGDIEFTSHPLELAVSSQQVDTKSRSYGFSSTVACEKETLVLRKSNHCITNAPSAPYGDNFLTLDAQPFCTEVHHCKLVSDDGRIDYEAERYKAASDNDFFLLFSSNDQSHVVLPPISGIVDKSNWVRYFGPFAGRAFVFATIGALDINLASRRDLKGMSGVGDWEAELIMQERAKRRFDNLEDASARLLGVGKEALKRFKFLPAV
ncbi:hypothetical protein BG004_005991 [Podila humilis]|nr:hypothetical protein BG004_005991 [Podila humilis]